MPCYFSVEFSFKNEKLYPSFVADIYNIFFQNGFPFKEGYWMAENLPIEEIIAWNQVKLNEGFRLGFTQHVKEDYRQILLNNPNYDHLRLFWTYSPKEIHLSWVIPELEVLREEDSNLFIRKRVTPIIELSQKVWEGGAVSLIQSCLEFDAGYIGLEQVEKEKISPICNPFLILGEEIYDSILSIKDYDVTKIANKGYLIIDRNKLID